MWGAYFSLRAYKRVVVVVIKMGAYIHGVLFLCGCLLSRFYGTLQRFRSYTTTFFTSFQLFSCSTSDFKFCGTIRVCVKERESSDSEESKRLFSSQERLSLVN